MLQQSGRACVGRATNRAGQLLAASWSCSLGGSARPALLGQGVAVPLEQDTHLVGRKVGTWRIEEHPPSRASRRCA